MEKQFSKKQVGIIGFVIAIVTAAIMIILQMFGITTPNEQNKTQDVKPIVQVDKK